MNENQTLNQEEQFKDFINKIDHINHRYHIKQNQFLVKNIFNSDHIQKRRNKELMSNMNQKIQMNHFLERKNKTRFIPIDQYTFDEIEDKYPIQ